MSQLMMHIAITLFTQYYKRKLKITQVINVNDDIPDEQLARVVSFHESTVFINKYKEHVKPSTTLHICQVVVT